MPQDDQRRSEIDELSEQMTPVTWGRFERVMFVAIFIMAVANLAVGLLALGPDLWG